MGGWGFVGEVIEGDIVNVVDTESGIVDELAVAGFHEFVGQAKNLGVGEVAVPEQDGLRVFVDESMELGKEGAEGFEFLELGDALRSACEVLLDGGLIAGLGGDATDTGETRDKRADIEDCAGAKRDDEREPEDCVGKIGTARERNRDEACAEANDTDSKNRAEDLLSLGLGRSAMSTRSGLVAGVEAESDAVLDAIIVPFLIVEVAEAVFTDETEEISFVPERGLVGRGVKADDVVVAMLREMKVFLGAEVEDGGDDVLLVFEGGIGEERGDADAEVIRELFIVLIRVGKLDLTRFALDLPFGAEVAA